MRETRMQFMRHTVENCASDYEYFVKVFNSFVENRVEMGRG
jgi:hypothetical protein